MNRKGFTLIELLVVISIIALLASVVLSSLSTARDKGRIAGAKRFASTAERAAGDYAIGIWDFDECSGSSTADRSGGGNSAIVSGPTWNADSPFSTGCSMTFNGTNQNLVVGSATSMDVGSTLTIMAWTKLSSATISTWHFIFAGANNDVGFGLNPTIGVSPRITQVNWVDGGAATMSVVNPTVWNHVAAVFTANTVTYYVNGLFAGKATANLTFTNTQKRIGSNGTAGGWFGGSLDAVRVFTKDLTASEIQKAYAADLARTKFAGR